MSFNLLIEFIKSDLYRYYGRVDFSVFLKAFLLNEGFIYSFWFRLSKSSFFLVRYLAMFILRVKSRKYKIYISPKVECGFGLYLGHGFSIVVNPTAKIGNNVNLSHHVSIGSNHGPAAIVGDRVYIGPSTSIIGNVNIGNDVIIGAGSIVTKNIKSKTVSVGNPSSVIRSNIEYNTEINNIWN